MNKVLDFLHSRTFVTHLTGLAGIVTTGYAVPQSPWVSLGVAALTGITQASHAYQAVKMQPTVTVDDVKKALAANG